jgi:hypothetical protein
MVEGIETGKCDWFSLCNIAVLNLHIGKNITELDNDGNGRCRNESVGASTYQRHI